jgi:hypothetical protein
MPMWAWRRATCFERIGGAVYLVVPLDPAGREARASHLARIPHTKVTQACGTASESISFVHCQ